MNKLIFLLLSLFLFQVVGFSQSWNQKNNFPSTSRYFATGFSNGGYGFICGGSQDNSVHYNELWRYDSGSDQWIAKSAFPGTPRRNLISFTIDSISYVGLGYNYSTNLAYNDAYAYNPNSDSWSQIASFPGLTKRGAKSASVNGKGYVVGGTAPRGSGTVSNQLWEYNPVTNSWTQKMDFPGGARTGGIAFASDSSFYFGLGHNHSVNFNDLWKYNPISNTWTIVASFPAVGRHNASVSVINGKAIVGGGLSAISGVMHQDYYSYDMVQNTWVSLPGFTNGLRYGSAAFSIGHKSYLFAGGNYSNSLNDVWEYTDTTFITSLNEDSKIELDLSIYPNPTQGLISIKNTSKKLLNISILNTNGQQVRSFILNGVSSQNVDLSELSKGLYFYHVRFKNEQYFGKIILN